VALRLRTGSEWRQFRKQGGIVPTVAAAFTAKALCSAACSSAMVMLTIKFDSFSCFLDKG
jgi:hypothetical protein